MYKIGSWVKHTLTGMCGTIDDIDLPHGLAFCSLKYDDYQFPTEMWVKLNDLEVVPFPDHWRSQS